MTDDQYRADSEHYFRGLIPQLWPDVTDTQLREALPLMVAHVSMTRKIWPQEIPQYARDAYRVELLRILGTARGTEDLLGPGPVIA